MNLPPLKAMFVLVFAILIGAVNFAEWLPIFAGRNAPIVTGTIVARQPIQRYGGVPGVDFTIRLAPGVEVHALGGRYLMEKVPEQVQFRYSGDPTREVFLFEHEENPLWIFLFLWGVSLFLIGYLALWWLGRSPHRAPQWTRPVATPPGTVAGRLGGPGP
jgi:hypothetical protein